MIISYLKGQKLIYESRIMGAVCKSSDCLYENTATNVNAASNYE